LKAVKENFNSAMKQLSGTVDKQAHTETEASKLEKQFEKRKICEWQ
jgi:hypothetical protein